MAKAKFTKRGVTMKEDFVDVGSSSTEVCPMKSDKKYYPSLHLDKHVPGLDRVKIGGNAVIQAKIRLTSINKSEHGESMGLEIREVKDINPGFSKKKLKSTMREVFSDEPGTVTRSNVSKEKKRKMKVAIAYAKARKGK